MTLSEFATAIVTVGLKYNGGGFWGRTPQRSRSVGGFAGDPHNWWLGFDMTYDSGPNRPGSETHTKSPFSCQECSADGLKVIHERSHDHYQPFDFKAGPQLPLPTTVEEIGQYKRR